jgi:outer membrane scaffolding protein for murein synthesis (MipA/OmpV family)
VKRGAFLLAVVLPAVLPAVLLPICCAAQDRPTVIGAAVRSRPAYDGSKSQVTDLIPVLRHYGQPWFVRTTQGVLEAGVRDELAPKFWAGAQLAYEEGRKQSESPFLQARNEPDLDPGASAGLHLEWDRDFGPMPVTFVIRARQNLDAERGGQADLRLTAGVLSWAGLQAVVFGQVTWGSENAVRSAYGAPDAGMLFVGAGVIASYDLTARWLLVGSLSGRWLRGAASDSALAETTSNWYGNAGLAYRF